MKWGVRKQKENKSNFSRKSNKYDIKEGTTLYRADSDPNKAFMNRKYTYVNVTNNLQKHMENVGGDTDNYKLKTTKTLKIASTDDYFYAVMKANHINPNKYLSGIPEHAVEKGKYAVENLLSSKYIDGWGGKNKTFNRTIKYLVKQGYDGVIDPVDGAQAEKHGETPMATVIFNPKKNIKIVEELKELDEWNTI